MKIILDSKIIRALVTHPSEILKNPLLGDRENQVSFGWPALLAYLELESLFTRLPVFDKTDSIFETCLTILHTSEDRDTLLSLYDHLFAKNLSEIKDLPEISAPFILEAIKQAREKDSFPLIEKVVSAVLTYYETALLENTSHTMHDLILNLSWNRTCSCLRHLFDFPSADQKFLSALNILRRCLIESYSHIKLQKKTSPSIYSLIEALFFYEVREENLQKHTASNWALLSESFPLIEKENILTDFPYIDDAIVSKETVDEDQSSCFLTLESAGSVESRLSLARYMLEKIEDLEPAWNFRLEPKKIVSLN
ncbi:MAG: hypothetical protein NTX49_02955 [Chlamydiae bacterium]|nr:hypothetical protein [Chlamydiota bacterium]